MKIKQFYKILILAVVILSGCQTTEKEAVTESAATDQLTTVILVRHAEKADDGTSDPDLNEQGEARAIELAQLLSTAGVDAIYSTPYKRTEQTGLPLAQNLGIEVTSYDPRDAEFISTLVDQNDGSTVLVVGHSNTIPGMVNSLLGAEKYGQLDEMEYDKLFVVVVRGEEAKETVLSF